MSSQIVNRRSNTSSDTQVNNNNAAVAAAAATADTAAKDDSDDATSYSSTKPVRWFDRLEHFTWAWYTVPMSTGGLCLLLSEQTQPHTFTGLQTIGKVVYIFDLTIFTLITMAITYRFIRWPSHFKTSITHPTEGLFVATFFLSLASIIAAMARYGIPSTGPWLVTAYRVLFWIYFAVTFLAAVGHYFLLFTSPLLRIEDMTPAWDLPIFPFMLSGTIAASGASFQPPDQAVPMIVGGLTAQGLGMMISVLMYASYIRRMINFGFPSANSRPAMFIAVGPPSFTSLALIGLANDFPVAYRNYFGAAIYNSPNTNILTGNVDSVLTIQILRVIATMTAVFIWSLSLWFFCIALMACLAAAIPAFNHKTQRLSFHLNWWAFVFPNVGFTIATIDIGKMFDSQGVMWVGSAMTILLVALYLFVGVCHVRAIWRKDILWHGKDEDFYKKERRVKHEKAEKMDCNLGQDPGQTPRDNNVVVDGEGRHLTATGTRNGNIDLEAGLSNGGAGNANGNVNAKTRTGDDEKTE